MSKQRCAQNWLRSSRVCCFAGFICPTHIKHNELQVSEQPDRCYSSVRCSCPSHQALPWTQSDVVQTGSLLVRTVGHPFRPQAPSFYRDLGGHHRLNPVIARIKHMGHYQESWWRTSISIFGAVIQTQAPLNTFVSGSVHDVRGFLFKGTCFLRGHIVAFTI